MPTPQFEEIIENSGFDQNAMPRWQMVALKSSTHKIKDVNLRFAAGLTVVNQNPPVATITENLTIGTPDLRRFAIEAKSPGIAFIDVDGPRIPIYFPRRLEVEVKDNKRFKIAYHFVDKTTYKPTDITGVDFNMNQIFEAQANVNFDMVSAAPLMSTSTLYGIVFELKHADRRKPQQREWDNLVDWGDKGADFNVYFMPWDGRPEERPTEMLAQDNHIICPDGMKLDEVERALAHEIGRFLGCKVIHNEKQRRQLLFRASSDDGDLAKFVRSEDHTRFNSRRLRDSRFIPKDCANTMNPTVQP